MTTLTTFKFLSAAIQRRIPKVLSGQKGRLCGDSTCFHFQRKRSFLVSKVISKALLQFSSGSEEMFPQDGGDPPGSPDDTLTSASTHYHHWSGYFGLDHRPWLCPAFPGYLRGRGGAVVSFPLHLGFFSHFTED